MGARKIPMLSRWGRIPTPGKELFSEDPQTLKCIDGPRTGSNANV